MTITIEAPELEASLTKAAIALNTTVNEYAAQILWQALAPQRSNGTAASDKSLRGSVLRYDDPFEPVAFDDREADTDQPGLQTTTPIPTGYGKFAHVPTSSDEFAARKEEERLREEGHHWNAF